MKVELHELLSQRTKHRLQRVPVGTNRSFWNLLKSKLLCNSFKTSSILQFNYPRTWPVRHHPCSRLPIKVIGRDYKYSWTSAWLYLECWFIIVFEEPLSSCWCRICVLYKYYNSIIYKTKFSDLMCGPHCRNKVDQSHNIQPIYFTFFLPLKPEE